MYFELQQIADYEFQVTNGRRVVATLTLDELFQIKHVALRASSDGSEERAVLVAVGLHATEYFIMRFGVTAAEKGLRHREVSREYSLDLLLMALSDPRVMRVDKVSELVESLALLGVTVTDPINELVRSVLDRVVRDSQFPEGITYQVGLAGDRLNYRKLVLIAPDGTRFTAWNDLERGQYVLPAYHPVMQGKRDSVGINGATDSVISSRPLAHMELLRDEGRSSRDLFGTWGSASHPFYASARQAVLQFVTKELHEAELELNLRRLLCGLLDLDGTYVAVTNWSHGPYDHPQNLVTRGLVHPPEDRARGQEGTCVWAYRTLARENALDGAEIPAWLSSEGWLDAYDAHVPSSSYLQLG